MFKKLFGLEQDAPTRDVYLFNTETRAKEIFTPLVTNSVKVKMYSCGPTVYDYAHIGNLRSYIFADIIRRVLMKNGYLVEQTINITDFGHLTSDDDFGEDKMMKGLKREGLPVTLESMRKLSDDYILAFKDDLAALNVLEPDNWARASDYIKKQISLIQTLDEKGFTYETSDGLYFDISRFPAYGRLGNINLEKIKSRARIEDNKEKRHPADFAVWKKGELGWDSKWGKGFPGWHIECSAMAMATLGKQIDIHTGGIDHVPIHHNAEIAQSEAVTGKQFVRYWLHNEFITIDNTKVSKSLGNTITLRHLLDKGFSGDDYRYWLLTAHYRTTVNFSWEALKSAKQALYRLKRYMYEDFKSQASHPDIAYLEKFDSALADDFDSPKAIAILWDMLKDDSLDNQTKCGTLLAMDDVLDIGLSNDPDDGVKSLGVISSDDLPENIQALVDEREAARIARNWPTSDAIRDKLKQKGYDIEDTTHGPKVSRS